MAVPCPDIVIEPRRNVHRDFCLGKRRLDCRNNLIEIEATKGIIRNATALLAKARITGIARNRILEKVRFNQPNRRLLRACSLNQVTCNPLRIGTIAGKDVRPTRSNSLCTICAMVRRSHIAINIALILVVFRDHVSVKDRGKSAFGCSTDHRPFPILVIGIIVANPDGQVGKSLALKIGICIKGIAPLPTKIEVVLAEGSERSCCQKQQTEKKGYSIFHNH